jgi:5'-methylthioadenosine phosphorylase
MIAELAVIGGTGFCLEGTVDEVETPYGKVPVAYTRMKGKRAVFISRHGPNHLPPHKVDYRAVIWAAKMTGAKRIVSTNTVGSMASHPAGCVFLPTDYVEFTKTRANTFFEEKAVHVDMSRPYCPQVRAALADAARSLGLPTAEGIYVCSEGPHLESPAQIRMMLQFGDVVGMTGYPEVVLAREAGLCYASICIVTNPACGMAGDGKLSIAEITETMAQSQENIREIIYRAVQNMPGERSCNCEDDTGEGML